MARAALLLDLAVKHLVGRRRQTLVSISGVAIGVGFFLAVSSLMVGSQHDFIDRLINAAPHIIIYDELRSPPPQPGALAFAGGAVVLRHRKTRNEVRGMKGWQEIMRAANEIPGAIASPSLTGAVTLSVAGRDEPVALIGIDPDLETRVSTIEKNLRAGHLRDLRTVQGGVILGEELATRMGLVMDDVVTATSPDGARRTLKVVGLFKRGVGQIGASSGYVLLREAQSVLARPFVINRIGIRLDDPARAQSVARGLEGRFSYKAESWQERSADLLGFLVTRNVIMYSVVSAILLVASFGIYTAVSTSVADKARDIAILRAIGFSRGDLQLLFVAEGTILAALGIVLGWGLGYALMGALGTLAFPINGEPEPLPLDRSPLPYLVAAAASLASGAVAAWLPSRKAARVDPVDILRGAV